MRPSVRFGSVSRPREVRSEGPRCAKSGTLAQRSQAGPQLPIHDLATTIAHNRAPTMQPTPQGAVEVTDGFNWHLGRLDRHGRWRPLGYSRCTGRRAGPGSSCWRLHEFGHWIAMRFTGQPAPRIMLVPFFGGVTLANHPHKTLFRDAFCALMGAGVSALPSLVSFLRHGRSARR